MRLIDQGFPCDAKLPARKVGIQIIVSMILEGITIIDSVYMFRIATPLFLIMENQNQIK